MGPKGVWVPSKGGQMWSKGGSTYIVDLGSHTPASSSQKVFFCAPLEHGILNIVPQEKKKKCTCSSWAASVSPAIGIQF